MSCGKCGKGKALCPVSLGLALGIVSGLAVFIWSLWILHYGVPPAMAGRMMVAPTLMGGVIHALWALLKGFLFGFFLALFYDFFACCMKSMCCKKSGESCGCNCGCKSCNVENKPVEKV